MMDDTLSMPVRVLTRDQAQRSEGAEQRDSDRPVTRQLNGHELTMSQKIQSPHVVEM